MKLKTILIFTILVILIFIINCSSKSFDSSENHVNKNTGIIKYLDLEGGFFGIISSENKKYDPINLSKEYAIDGLKVSFEYKLRPDLVSSHMFGEIMEIISIKKL